MKNMLTQVREDMSVYDREGDKIGTVKAIQFGDEDLERPGVETSTARAAEVKGNDLVDDLARAFTTEDDMPSELRERLLRYGYITVDAGVTASKRYVRVDQIDKVAGDRVELNTTLDDLVAA